MGGGEGGGKPLFSFSPFLCFLNTWFKIISTVFCTFYWAVLPVRSHLLPPSLYSSAQAEAGLTASSFSLRGCSHLKSEWPKYEMEPKLSLDLQGWSETKFLFSIFSQSLTLLLSNFFRSQTLCLTKCPFIPFFSVFLTPGSFPKQFCGHSALLNNTPAFH